MKGLHRQAISVRAHPLQTVEACMMEVTQGLTRKVSLEGAQLKAELSIGRERPRWRGRGTGEETGDCRRGRQLDQRFQELLRPEDIGRPAQR